MTSDVSSVMSTPAAAALAAPAAPAAAPAAPGNNAVDTSDGGGTNTPATGKPSRCVTISLPLS